MSMRDDQNIQSHRRPRLRCRCRHLHERLGQDRWAAGTVNRLPFREDLSVRRDAEGLL
jgi:hypothetical protein